MGAGVFEEHQSKAPHRTTEVFDLCHACRAPADRVCIRCGRPHCADHWPATGDRCRSCDADLAERLASAHEQLPSELGELEEHNFWPWVVVSGLLAIGPTWWLVNKGASDPMQAFSLWLFLAMLCLWPAISMRERLAATWKWLRPRLLARVRNRFLKETRGRRECDRNELNRRSETSRK